MRKKSKGTHPVVFRLASQRWHEDWFSHKQDSNIEILDLQSYDIMQSVDRYHARNWEIQSSVDGGKTWQTQRNIKVNW
jgi:hypothetical protein